MTWQALWREMAAWFQGLPWWKVVIVAAVFNAAVAWPWAKAISAVDRAEVEKMIRKAMEERR